MGYIYMLKNKVNGKIYIGQTTRPIRKRLGEHETGESRKCRAIYNAIQYHGWVNFEKDWYECPDEDLNFDEELLVREMETLAPKGYNLREGGGNRGKLSDETKQKISESHLGKTLSDEHKQKLSESQRGDKNHNFGKTGENSHMFGKIHSEGTKRKIGDAQLGIPKSEEHKQNMRKPKSEEHKQNLTESHRGEKNPSSKRVYQYDLEGNFIKSFASCGEAALYLKKGDGSAISSCARGTRESKIAYKFKWSYSAM
jgi:group I intron endonuclease